MPYPWWLESPSTARNQAIRWLPEAVFAPLLRIGTCVDTTLVQQLAVFARSVCAAHQIAQILDRAGAEFTVGDQVI
jgi:hypothetical protein